MYAETICGLFHRAEMYAETIYGLFHRAALGTLVVIHQDEGDHLECISVLTVEFLAHTLCDCPSHQSVSSTKISAKSEARQWSSDFCPFCTCFACACCY